MRSFLLYLLTVFFSTLARGQDTVFVRSYELEEKINNIDGNGISLIVRTPNHLYRFENGEFIEIKDAKIAGSRFTWLSPAQRNSKSLITYNTNQAPEHKFLLKESFRNLMPGYYSNFVWQCQIGPKLYINHRGLLLEYEIFNFYSLQYKNKSTRHILQDDSIRIVSTYGGIFIDKKEAYDSPPLPSPLFSNGEACKIKGNYYLCTDDIYKLENGKFTIIWVRPNSNGIFKLIELGEEIFYFSKLMTGRVDLSKGRQLDTILQVKEGISDAIVEDGRLFVSAFDGNIYEYKGKNQFNKINIGSPIYDIESSRRNTLLLSCNNGINELNPKNYSKKQIIKHPNVIQSIDLDNLILFTTYEGLFALQDDKLYNVIERVEFNRKGLTSYVGTIYAGSIDGLFVIDELILRREYLPSLTPIQEIDIENNVPSIILYILLAISIIATAFYFRSRRAKKKIELEFYKREKITPEKIKQIMIEDPSIVSVKLLAEKLNTSPVQLNRILHKYNTSGLELMKEIKKEIVFSMIDEKKSLQEISLRVGYSIPFIKREFLKEL